ASSHYHRWRRASGPATIRPDQHADSDQEQQRPVQSPLRLAGHETPWQDIDSLQEPHASHEETENADDASNDSHGVPGRGEDRLNLRRGVRVSRTDVGLNSSD